LPRDLTLQEIKSITEANDSIKFEVFVKNESCANIGGFCTFTHTAYEKQEIFPFKQLVYLLGKISGNRIFSGSIKGKNKKIIRNALRDFFHSGIIKPCNLNYSVTVESEREADNRKQESEGIKRYFKAGNFLQDACGGCALVDFLSMNIYGVKIVGRGHDTGIKLKDILFVKKSLLTAAGGSLTPVEKKEAIKENFVEIFGYPCSSECYYP
ncbi:MAG: hypothetical protein FJZ15_05610, partial [Candidatus Omnitrophica bacterium]|nr:hypothetical protein [Candidatus Omnitrophota bacterium]